MMRIIFLDIDGVLLTPYSFDFSYNKKIFEFLSSNKEEYPKDSLKYINYIQEHAKFNEESIELINRLCEKSEAKIVIISNWRRSYGSEKTLNKLIEQGIKKEYFHNDYAAKIRGMSSSKMDDIYSWLNNNHLNKELKPEYKDLDIPSKEYDEQNLKWRNYYDSHGYDYLIIDDNFLEQNTQLIINENIGFNIDYYRIACGYFNITDEYMNVFKIEPDLENDIKNLFYNRISYCTFMYSINDNKEYNVTRSYLLNKSTISIMDSYYLRKNVNDIYETRFQAIMEELKLKFPEKFPRKHKDIFEDSKSFCEFYNIAENDFQKHPHHYPVLVIKVEDKLNFYYATDSNNPFDYLVGYRNALLGK